jgi:hypothetical protein
MNAFSPIPHCFFVSLRNFLAIFTKRDEFSPNETTFSGKRTIFAIRKANFLFSFRKHENKFFDTADLSVSSLVWQKNVKINNSDGVSPWNFYQHLKNKSVAS